MEFKPLTWSQDGHGAWNGKVGPVTMFCVAYYAARGWFVAPKLPGLNKTVAVGSQEEGQTLAEKLYRQWLMGLVL
jgi:hypothetical protein